MVPAYLKEYLCKHSPDLDSFSSDAGLALCPRTIGAPDDVLVESVVSDLDGTVATDGEHTELAEDFEVSCSTKLEMSAAGLMPASNIAVSTSKAGSRTIGALEDDLTDFVASELDLGVSCSTEVQRPGSVGGMLESGVTVFTSRLVSRAIGASEDEQTDFVTFADPEVPCSTEVQKPDVVKLMSDGTLSASRLVSKTIGASGDVASDVCEESSLSGVGQTSSVN